MFGFFVATAGGGSRSGGRLRPADVDGRGGGWCAGVELRVCAAVAGGATAIVLFCGGKCDSGCRSCCFGGGANVVVDDSVVVVLLLGTEDGPVRWVLVVAVADNATVTFDGVGCVVVLGAMLG